MLKYSNWINKLIIPFLFISPYIKSQNNWIHTNGPLSIHPITSIASGTAGEFYAAVSLQGVYKSIDEGKNWWCVFRHPEYTYNFITVNKKGELFLGGLDGGNNSIYKSTNFGESWYPLPLTNGFFILAMAFDKDDNILISDWSGLFQGKKK